MSTQYYTATSIDGFIADERNSLDWLFEVQGPEPPQETFEAFIAGVGAVAMGATTYEWMLEHEGLLEHPEKWSGYFGEIPCWVFTHRTLPAVPDANLTFVQGDVAPIHAQMARAADGTNVWLAGGGDLVGQFADVGLLDEIILDVAPVTLGGGAPLLPRRIGAAHVELLDVVRNGRFARLTYRVRNPSNRPEAR